MKRCTNAREFISIHPRWQETLNALRGILGSSELEETIKWGVPVYTLGGKNVVGLTAFKNHAALWFFQGALLQDKAGKLVNAQEGRTQAQRQWRFQSSDSVDETLVRDYIAEAIENQRKGKVVQATRKKDVSVPCELMDALDHDEDLKNSFTGLAPYKQREYAEHIAGAKRADTKTRRLEKIIPMILQGKGLNEKYRC